jgi:ATP-dependent Clp protease, protease subunit
MSEPNQRDQLLRYLMGNRIVDFPDPIDWKSAETTAVKLLELQAQDAAKPIHLLIDSSGGVSRATLHLCDLIRHVLTVPVHALVPGRCHSAATFALLACKVRRCTPHATFQIHSCRLGEDVSITQAENAVADARRIQDRAVKLYVDRLGKPREEIAEILRRGDQPYGWVIEAEEALSLGLVTEIVTGDAGIFARPPAESG